VKYFSGKNFELRENFYEKFPADIPAISWESEKFPDKKSGTPQSFSFWLP
jgi:hypothetical protein